MQYVNEKYYIHKNNDGTFAIWTIDDMYKMTKNIPTFEEANKLLKIFPHTLILETKGEDNGR